MRDRIERRFVCNESHNPLKDAWRRLAFCFKKAEAVRHLLGSAQLGGAVVAAAGQVVFKRPRFVLRQRAERIERGTVYHRVGGGAGTHSGLSTMGLSASRSFIIASRVRVLTVPSGNERCAAISVCVMPE